MTWFNRGCLLAGLLAFVALAFAALVLLVWVHDSKRVESFRATRATVLDADSSAASGYQYRYSVGDRVCQGADPSAVTRAPGTRIDVYYNTNKLCDSVPQNPADLRVGNMISLLVVGGIFVPFLALYLWGLALLTIFNWQLTPCKEKGSAS